MLKKKFYTLCQNFTSNEETIKTLWEEIKEQHSHPNRYYHTLKHLEHIYTVLVKPTLSIEFAIFYHDIIYNVSQNDNEEQSAILCSKRLNLLNVPKKLIDNVYQLIIETKTHQASSKENALFLDADLAILASSLQKYKKYTEEIRKEYGIYNDTTYFTGRKKVLKSFLKKDKIYESNYFYERYENKARKNLDDELTRLYSP